MSDTAVTRRSVAFPPRAQRWLITGVAGFIGSHLLHALLENDQHVVGLDNLATGKHHNLRAVRALVSSERWERFTFIEGDVRSATDCRAACAGVDIVLHEAALASVPASFADPAEFEDVNVLGFLRLATEARAAGIRRFVYASSSAVYGDSPTLPKHESDELRPLSPYALNKLATEQYARILHDADGMSFIGLRYFNVFGPRQDPHGAYAAVVPLWTAAGQRGEPGVIYGDGTATRDFVYVADVVEANLRAGLASAGPSRVFNIGSGVRTSVAALYAGIREAVSARSGRPMDEPRMAPERHGDIAHSVADCSLAERELGFRARYSLTEGLGAMMAAELVARA